MFRYALSLLALLCLTPPVVLAAKISITVPRVIPFDKSIQVPDRIRNECHLDTYLTDSVRDVLRRSHDRVASVDFVDKSQSGLVLDMAIIDVHGRPGGMKTGSKSLTVEGTLWKDGTEIGNFVARRGSLMSAHTCKLLHRSADEIAEDIADWLKSPGKDARLGDARK
jgi:hypothetical protein